MDKKKLVVASTAATAFAGALYEGVVRIFASVAFDRKPIVNLLGSGNHELKGIAKEGQDWLHAHDNQIVYMTNTEGMRLKGHYIPAPDAKRTVIEFHGWHGSWDVDFSASSPKLSAAGCNLLLVEERGQGESDGAVMTFGIREKQDVLEWVNWYQKNIDPEIPIYLGGVSMGASVLMMASADPFPKEVRGIFADCGFTSAYEIIRIVGKRSFHIPEHPFMDSMVRYCKQKLGIDLREGDALKALARTRLPILFVHGKADNFVPCWMSARAYEECASEKEILLVEGAGHGMSFTTDMESYMKKILDFFQKYDTKESLP